MTSKDERSKQDKQKWFQLRRFYLLDFNTVTSAIADFSEVEQTSVWEELRIFNFTNCANAQLLGKLPSDSLGKCLMNILNELISIALA